MGPGTHTRSGSLLAVQSLLAEQTLEARSGGTHNGRIDQPSRATGTADGTVIHVGMSGTRRTLRGHVRPITICLSDSTRRQHGGNSLSCKPIQLVITQGVQDGQGVHVMHDSSAVESTFA